AGIVFVQPASLPLRARRFPSAAGRAAKTRTPSQTEAAPAEFSPGLALGEARSRAHALPVVQVEEYRRTLGRGDQQIFKFAQHARTDDGALIAGDQVAIGALADEHIEVVEPEIGE